VDVITQDRVEYFEMLWYGCHNARYSWILWIQWYGCHNTR
jgi:hypothetical protein